MACPVDVDPHHVGIFVSDIDRALAWWEEMLGFQKMFENTFYLPDYGDARMAWVKKDGFYVELYDFLGWNRTRRCIGRPTAPSTSPSASTQVASIPCVTT